MDNAELFFLTTSFSYRSYAWNRAALEQLKTSGGLRRMRNDRLVQLISDYDALSQHLDQDYREDEESARAMWNLANLRRTADILLRSATAPAARFRGNVGVLARALVELAVGHIAAQQAYT